MFNIDLFDNISENIYVLKKSNWAYEGVEDFQLSCVEFVNNNPHVVILIFCHHQHCFTLGRGLQKLSPQSGIKLIDYDESTKLDYPLFKLKRGGGLTFHYPGQIVLYPILNLNFHKLSAQALMLKVLDMTKSILETRYNITSLTVDQTLLGLWSEEFFGRLKVASIGLAITRYTTYHGLALNVLKDDQMFNHLKRLNPCGITGESYRAIEEILGGTLESSEMEQIILDFQEKFCNLIKSQSMIERQISSLTTNLEIST